LYGVARPAERWERDYLAPRVERYDDEAITRLSSSGEMVWVGSGASEDGVVDALTALRFVRRGTGRAWLAGAEDAAVSAEAQRVRDVLASEGASFFDDIKTATGLGTRALRDALRELVAAGQVTCDTAESMRAVIRWRPLVTPRVRNQPDPTRWLPADFVAQRPVVQRRPNLRRLPRWKRPDKDGAESDAWPGRWSLVRSARILGPEQDESALAEQVARQWLARYGVVSRDWWRRERPAVSWRAVYRELKRLEFRGDVRRGYFVRGLAGAQFALPDAVNQLRESIASDSPVIVMAASDPANAYALPPAPEVTIENRDPLTRRRSRGTVYATRGGVVLLVVESRGRRITVRPDASAAEITEAARSVIPHLTRAAGTRHDPIVETIDGASALASPHTAAFVAAGFRVVSGGLRYYASLAG
jgi:ATP-dependent Lhr-like helicase